MKANDPGFPSIKVPAEIVARLAFSLKQTRGEQGFTADEFQRLIDHANTILLHATVYELLNDTASGRRPLEITLRDDGEIVYRLMSEQDETAWNREKDRMIEACRRAEREK